MQLLKQFLYTYGSLLATITLIAGLMFMLYGCAPVLETQDEDKVAPPDYVECFENGEVVYSAILDSRPYKRRWEGTSYYVTEQRTGKKRSIPVNSCYVYYGGK